MLTQARLKELLSYDPETGKWTWRVTRGAAHAGHVVDHHEGSGYIQFTIDQKNYRSCRLAFLYQTGEWPVALVDHIDLNRTNDRWANLRAATMSQNKANSAGYANNTSGFKGVAIKKGHKSKPFFAFIGVNGKRKHLGYFPTIEEAVTAYRTASERYFGEFARAA